MSGAIQGLIGSLKVAAAATDPDWASVTLLLPGDGTNGAQNNTFTDASTNNFTITRNGNVTQGTFSPFTASAPYSAATKGGSGYFDGTNDRLTIADNAALRPGTGNFTIEAWVFRAASGADHTIYAKGGASTGFVFQITSTDVLRFTDTTSNIDSTGTISANTWTHVAVVREGTGSNQLKLYINGVNDGQGTVSTNFNQTEELRIGEDRGATGDFNGYISNVRFVTSAVYTSGFTPSTTPLTAITNTQLLLSFTNAGIIDNAMLNVLETVGDAQISTAQSKWGGSSIAFDGTGDSLSVPASSSFGFGTGDFTIEFWTYVTSTANTPYWIDARSTSTANEAVPVLYINSGNYEYFVTGSARITGGAFPLNQWVHVALVRSSGTTTLYSNGTSTGTPWSDSTNYANCPLIIGQRKATTSQSLTGYIDDLRITKGVARYTTTFTPPAAAFPTS